MATTKLSITIRGALEKKYSAPALARLDTAIGAWIAADKTRGIQTRHVHLDRAADMAGLGVKAITGRVTPNKVKRTLDALVTALAPEYIVILGAGDVVPYFMVPNPSFSTSGDDDELVPTDNPYACSAKYRRSSRATYLVPDRVLGRMPDLPGSADPSCLVDYLTHATAWRSQPASAYSSTLAVCCATWKGSGAACVKELGASSKTLLVTPPAKETTAAVKSRHTRRTHLIKCHGDDHDVRFYGEGGGDFPPIITSRAIAGRITPGTLAGAMCCYGAQVFDPNAPEALMPGVAPIPIVYLQQGAYGFLGSTTLAWVGDADMLCADWVVTSFLQRTTGGASLGRAALEAKQDLLRWLQQQGTAPDQADEKTMLQFMLLGDPSIHPVLPKATPAPASPQPAARGPVAATMRAMVVGAAGRRARRVMRFELGRVLRAGLPARRLLKGTAAAAPIAAVAAAMLARMKAKDPHKVAKAPTCAERLVVAGSSSRRAGPVAAGLRARRAAVAAPADASLVQYSWSVRLASKGIRRVGFVTVNADAEGRVVGQRMVLSS